MTTTEENLQNALAIDDEFEQHLEEMYEDCYQEACQELINQPPDKEEKYIPF